MSSLTPLAALLAFATAITLAAFTSSAGAHALQRKHPAKTVPLVVKVDDGGFRWGDAGIGAAAGFGGALVLAGGLALAGGRHRVAGHLSNGKEEPR